MNWTREYLTLCQHCEVVGEICYVVLWSLINSFQRLVTLKTRLISSNLTLRGTVGSYLATEYAVVFVSIVLNTRDSIPGLDPNSLLYSAKTSSS